MLRLTIILIFAFYANISNADSHFPCKITHNSIAKIKLGTPLNQIKSIYPIAKLERTTDGDGVALVSFSIKNQDLAVIYAGEDDNDSAVNLSKKIEYIETLNPICKTNNNIHLGATVKKVAKILGGVKNITLSEIESRQYVEFERQPKNSIYRIDYCGDFKNGARKSKKYQSGCKILSIAITSRFSK